MYRETEKYNPPSAGSMFFQIAGYVILVLLLGAVCNFLREAYRIPFVDYLPFAVVVVLTWLIYRTRILEFRYSLIEDQLVFERVNGRRQSTVASCRIEQIEAYMPYAEKKVDKGCVNCTLPSSQNRRILRFTQEGKSIAVVFAPTAKLDGKIKALMEQAAQP